SAEDVDVFTIMRAWYGYAQKPLPPMDPDFQGVMDYQYDRRRHRVPKMAHQIFRGYPARAMAYRAEGLEQEGWFDTRDRNGEGWIVKGWFKDDQGLDREVEIGRGTEEYDAGVAWSSAYEMYKEYGRQNGLYLSPEERRELNERAQLFRTTYRVGPNEEVAGVRPEHLQGPVAASRAAHSKLRWNEHYRSMTNF